MQLVTDLHLHSKYSRTVSQSMTLPVMAQFAVQKGLNLLSTSDFTHPLWFKELQSQLFEAGEGIYKLKEGENKDVLFLLSTEISSIYKQGDKLRRIHNLVFVPDFTSAEKLKDELIKRGCNLSADGRPIIGLSSRNLLELILSIDERSLLIPCHVWTPHFGVYGSKSGFESLSECFEELAPYVYGIETGISSDPEMNWRIPELTDRSILSFSDAHSPANMGREATAFELEKPTYENLRSAIMRKGGTKNKLTYTVEFYPEEGKYHYSGHRNCKVSFSPEDLKYKGNVCPVCQRELTEGVATRIEQLAGSDFAKGYSEKVSDGGVKWYTDSLKNHPPYVKLVRLIQIIAQTLGSTVTNQKTIAQYDILLKNLGSELDILLKSPLSEIEKHSSLKIVEGIAKVRRGEIELVPGFDGEYGKVKIWDSAINNPLGKDKEKNPQLSFNI